MQSIGGDPTPPPPLLPLTGRGQVLAAVRNDVCPHAAGPEIAPLTSDPRGVCWGARSAAAAGGWPCRTARRHRSAVVAAARPATGATQAPSGLAGDGRRREPRVPNWDDSLADEAPAGATPHDGGSGDRISHGSPRPTACAPTPPYGGRWVGATAVARPLEEQSPCGRSSPGRCLAHDTAGHATSAARARTTSAAGGEPRSPPHHPLWFGCAGGPTWARLFQPRLAPRAPRASPFPRQTRTRRGGPASAAAASPSVGSLQPRRGTPRGRPSPVATAGACSLASCGCWRPSRVRRCGHARSVLVAPHISVQGGGESQRPSRDAAVATMWGGPGRVERAARTANGATGGATTGHPPLTVTVSATRATKKRRKSRGGRKNGAGAAGVSHEQSGGKLRSHPRDPVGPPAHQPLTGRRGVVAPMAAAVARPPAAPAAAAHRRSAERGDDPHGGVTPQPHVAQRADGRAAGVRRRRRRRRGSRRARRVTGTGPSALTAAPQRRGTSGETEGMRAERPHANRPIGPWPCDSGVVSRRRVATTGHRRVSTGSPHPCPGVPEPHSITDVAAGRWPSHPSRDGSHGSCVRPRWATRGRSTHTATAEARAASWIDRQRAVSGPTAAIAVASTQPHAEEQTLDETRACRLRRRQALHSGKVSSRSAARVANVVGAEDMPNRARRRCRVGARWGGGGGVGNEAGRALPIQRGRDGA